MPPGFDHSLIPEIVEQKRDWVEKHLARLNQAPASATGARLPHEIKLPVVGETWRVVYRIAEQDSVAVREQKPGVLLVSGKVSDQQACREALIRWLKRRAKRSFTAALDRLAAQCGFSYSRVVIRGQKTRWGSYSSSGTVSLNYKLLFLPPRLVRYVLVHELCHTVELNHSQAFWQLVRRFVPDANGCRRDLQQASRLVPDWAN